MARPIRTVFLSGGIAAIIAGALVSPSLFPMAFAAEPQKHLLDTAKEIFPPPFDLDSLAKFKLVADDSISTDVQRTQIVHKIAFGRRTAVQIVTTPSGTYSSDGLASDNVRYPGIDRLSADETNQDYAFGTWVSPRGTRTWTRIDRGSFTFITTTFTPAARQRS